MTLGDWGYLSIITALVFSVCASISYFRVLLGKGEQKEWLINARGTFLLHTAGVAGAWIVLLILVFSHRYDYSYVWEHVSNELPWYFVLSSIWEGKQGSFLLWVFWHSMIGVVFITAFRRNHQHHAGVMAILSALQAMLLAMVLGVVIPGTGITIGDSPFLTLKQATQSPIFEQNPNFVPNNGNGLNILLQNVWVAIHPPIIFMGYAVAGVAFGYALQALISQRYKTWVPSMMFWNTAAVFMIGTGILMGSWWAYETLNFGGYWSWDPVENAVLIPWLVLLAGLHALLRFNQKNKGLKLALALPLAGYIMIVYASFLTVSGILGEASVHSFTDSGLKGQLALWLLTIIAVPVALFAIRWKDISFETRNENTHSKADLWMVMGVVVLLLAAFQLLMPLSIPIFNKFSQWLGGSGNLAPPAEPMQFYGKFQLWFAIAIAALSAWVQQYYMAKSKKVDQQNVFFIAAAASLLATGIYVLITRDLQVQYWIYTAAAVFTLVVNTQLVVNFMKNGKTRLVAGAVAHVGMGIFLLGILFSSVMDEVITKNDFAAKENGREHALLV